jgi:hypothetical protein
MRHLDEQVDLLVGLLEVESPRKEGLGWPADLAKYTRLRETGGPTVVIPVRFLRINDDQAKIREVQNGMSAFCRFSL